MWRCVSIIVRNWKYCYNCSRISSIINKVKSIFDKEQIKLNSQLEEDLTRDGDGDGGAVNWSQIEALVDDIWCIFNIIDKSESDVNTKITDVLCNIINHLKQNLNVIVRMK